MDVATRGVSTVHTDQRATAVVSTALPPYLHTASGGVIAASVEAQRGHTVRTLRRVKLQEFGRIGIHRRNCPAPARRARPASVSG